MQAMPSIELSVRQFLVHCHTSEKFTIRAAFFTLSPYNTYQFFSAPVGRGKAQVVFEIPRNQVRFVAELGSYDLKVRRVKKAAPE